VPIVKRVKPAAYARQCRRVLIAHVAGGAAAVLLSFVCIGFLLIPVVVAIALCGLIFAIIAGIKANNGEAYRYPWSLTLIK
jgi:uncharacterized Tic20 family protein